MEIIRIIIYIIVLVLWAIIGFLCWIPLLARATASVAAAILYCTITESDPSPVKTTFESAVSFYARGFQAIDQVLDPDIRDSKVKHTSGIKIEEKFGRVVLEMAWTVFFWGTIFFGIYTFFHDSVKPHLEQGLAYSKEGKYDLAISEYSEALKEDPKNIDTYNNRGSAYYDSNNYDLAINDYSQCINIDPTAAGCYFNRGLVYIDKGNSEEAISNFKKVLEISQDSTLRQKSEQKLQILSTQKQ